MMKSIKRGMAVLLSVLLMVPAQPVMAAESVSAGLVEKNAIQNEAAAEKEAQEDSGTLISGNNEIVTELPKASSSNADSPSDMADPSDTVDPSDTAEKASPDSAKKPDKTAEDEVIFNTGNYAVRIVSREDFFDKELGDGYFEEDGSYTIQIPEENPFFPYEVQFTYDGETASEWFMSPDDTVEVGGHSFSISAYFDNTVVTQMTLNIAGEAVVVYPEKKEFSDYGVMPMSLLPLEERWLHADLTGFTPAEMTMVSFDQIFTGTEALKSGAKVVWKYADENDNYTASESGDVVDLSYGIANGFSEWEMIVGTDDQLAADNIRYIVNLELTASGDWLIPQVYTEDEAGNRKSINVNSYHYGDDYYEFYYDEEQSSASDDRRELEIGIEADSLELGQKAYIGLELNEDKFAVPNYDHLEVYEGRYLSAKEAVSGKNITDEIFNPDMTVKGAGYSMGEGMSWITIVTYDESGHVTGCLPFRLYLYQLVNRISTNLVTKTENGWRNAASLRSRREGDRHYNLTYTLWEQYPIDGEYFLQMKYYKSGILSPSDVTAAYKGQYSSIEEAKKSGAEDIKNILFSDNPEIGGFSDDYRQSVSFTVFIGEDSSENQEIYSYSVKIEEGKHNLSGSTTVNFVGLMDANGDIIPVYVVDDHEDSYAEYNYLTMLVGEEVDLTAVAPEFYASSGVKLYSAGSSSPEVSGKSIHDFSEGAIQYTASAENGTASKNYWLQIVKASDKDGQLYINSLADENAGTAVENGVVYSTREIMLDGYHERVHDILLANMNLIEIPSLSVELDSNEVELDGYWTLKGSHSLSGFMSTDLTTNYGELSNLAKIRIKTKDGTDRGSEISGTLTIKSNGETLIVLTLTGTIGDPGITTKEIPPAVKYVPYGTMIQNSNKYSWNTPFYTLSSGRLPSGMIVKPNGELYGVPTETGEFTFSVRMKNSSPDFSDSVKTYTLIVNENTDMNVENATDKGYTLTQRIIDLKLSSTDNQTLVSQGTYAEFVDIYLDGVKLKSGEDYISEEGSTRITIRNQTLKAANQTGTHTLGIEFRTKDTNTLKRAAQNYKVESKTSGGSSSSSSSSSGASAKKVTGDPKRGITDSLKGIITGEGAGYCRWQQDEKGWKLIYVDGTFACGSAVGQADGSSVVQPAWEKVNGAWYAFGSDGYLMTGWVFDYQLNAWYYMTVDSGMKTGWYYDDQDHCTYYLDAETGAIITGWKQIDGNWYYFTEMSVSPTWNFNEEQGVWVYDLRSKHKPYGSMYHGERTPDGYYVEESGIWRN